MGVEKPCEEISWEEVITVLWASKREIEFLGEVLGAMGMLQDSDLPEAVHPFLEVVPEGYPAL